MSPFSSFWNDGHFERMSGQSWYFDPEIPRKKSMISWAVISPRPATVEAKVHSDHGHL